MRLRVFCQFGLLDSETKSHFLHITEERNAYWNPLCLGNNHYWWGLDYLVYDLAEISSTDDEVFQRIIASWTKHLNVQMKSIVIICFDPSPNSACLLHVACCVEKSESMEVHQYVFCIYSWRTWPYHIEHLDLNIPFVTINLRGRDTCLEQKAVNYLFKSLPRITWSRIPTQVPWATLSNYRTRHSPVMQSYSGPNPSTVTVCTTSTTCRRF